MSLILWSHLPKDQSKLSLNESSSVRENVERLLKNHSNHLTKSSFHRISSGTQHPFSVQHDLDLLGQIADLAAPNAQIQLVQIIKDKNELDELEKTVKLAGLKPLEKKIIKDVQIDDLKEAAENLQWEFNDQIQLISLNCLCGMRAKSRG